MSSQVTNPNTEAAILARLIQIGRDELPRGAAEYLLSIRFGDRDIARMNELSELARQGRLTTKSKLSSTATFMLATSSPSCSLKGAALCGVRLSNQAY